MLNRDEVAALIGVKPETVTHYAFLTAAKPAAERQPWDFPLPDGWKDRPAGSPGRKQERAWDEAAVVAWQAARLTRPPVRQPRDEAGKFAPRVRAA
jgi:hypothetical protein